MYCLQFLLHIVLSKMFTCLNKLYYLTCTKTMVNFLLYLTFMTINMHHIVIQKFNILFLQCENIS
jgi:hypothetical protein